MTAGFYTDSATPPPSDRDVMPPATTSTRVGDDRLPHYPASTVLTSHSVFTGLATLHRVVLGRVGGTVREAVSFNAGHTLIGFLATTEDALVYVTPSTLDLDPPSGPRPGGVDIDPTTDRATAALLIAAVDSPRQWFGPFDTCGLAEAFLPGHAGGSGRLALTPPPTPDQATQEELLDQLSVDEIAGIGYALTGDSLHPLDHYDLIAVHDLADAGCRTALLRDVRGLYAFVCGECEHGDFGDCTDGCPIGWCRKQEGHKVGYSFDLAGATAWHRTQIGR
ncbi:hypothetical protein [Saccharothrix sp.]|uniref:hypothetical protein n=1 Tax=Saccharothrix sp. TaxID=1873460 RepID=UPI002812481D|nr:hypothetical protein [Saccharothrix sp.]